MRERGPSRVASLVSDMEQIKAAPGREGDTERMGKRLCARLRKICWMRDNLDCVRCVHLKLSGLAGSADRLQQKERV
jgi:hypothetical protein